MTHPQLIRYRTLDGVEVLIESTTDSPPDGNLSSGRDRVIGEAAMAFEEALHRVWTLTATLANQVRQSAADIDEASLEFGVAFDAEAGVVVAKASAEANLKIQLKWAPKAH